MHESRIMRPTKLFLKKMREEFLLPLPAWGPGNVSLSLPVVLTLETIHF
jgi:hypothetical protein